MKKIGLLMMGLLVLGQAEFKRGDNDVTVIDTNNPIINNPIFFIFNTLSKFNFIQVGHKTQHL